MCQREGKCYVNKCAEGMRLHVLNVVPWWRAPWCGWIFGCSRKSKMICVQQCGRAKHADYTRRHRLNANLHNF